MMSDSYQSFQEFAVETAYLAGKITLGYFQTGVHADYKSDQTPVTIADRGAEELIRSRIEARYPRHSIIGEELGAVDGQDKSHRWFIDPIDGTRAFVCGVPLFAVLLGLEIEGVVRVGAAYFPALDEMLTAATGHGCWWNGRRARVSKVSSLERSVVAFGHLANFARYNRDAAWEQIQKKASFCTGWGDAYGHLLVATGRAELMLDPIMNTWDCGPFPPILEEAGGFFGDWSGKSTIYGAEALSATPGVLAEVLDLIQKADHKHD
jgi:myo-inositol-1(or 4)-monophosphatase